MTILDLLKGKKVKVMTDAKVEVELEIKEVEYTKHSQDVGPSTQENDWWPETREWHTYTVTFTNGFVKEYDSLEQLSVLP